MWLRRKEVAVTDYVELYIQLLSCVVQQHFFVNYGYGGIRDLLDSRFASCVMVWVVACDAWGGSGSA